MNRRKLSIIVGFSYFIIFFAAIFANFYVIEAILKTPLETVTNNDFMIRLGIIAFLITVVFDIVVAWALYLLYKTHYLSTLSTYFRMMHAAIMGVAIFTLPLTLKATNDTDVLNYINTFNTIWLIGLFFFGIHLILLGRIIKTPKFITLFLILAGLMYMIDTCAHFLLADYEKYSSVFLTLVATPSIVGEMSLAIWLLFKGFKHSIQ